VGDREAELLKMSLPFSAHLRYKSTENGLMKKEKSHVDFPFTRVAISPDFQLDLLILTIHQRELVKFTQALTLLKAHPSAHTALRPNEPHLSSPPPNNIHQRWGGLKSCLFPTY
jgi:hypothetical protein